MKTAKQNIKIYFIFLSTLLCLNSYSQLHISEGSVIQLNDDLVSQEEMNAINASILGPSALVFNADQKQVLRSTTDEVVLSNLTVHKTNLQISSAFTIKGDMTVTSSVMNITKPVSLKGELQIDQVSLIAGVEFIKRELEVYPYDSPVTTTQAFKLPLSVAESPIEKDQGLNLCFENQTNFHFIEVLKNTIYCKTPSPPPKLGC